MDEKTDLTHEIFEAYLNDFSEWLKPAELKMNVIHAFWFYHIL